MSAHALIVEPFETLAFMRAALVACLALALTNGAVGTLLVLRRMSLDGDVLGHAVMPGAAVGFLYAGPSPGWLSLGGLASGLAVAALAGLITGERTRRDAGLVAFYLIALSLGVVMVAWRGRIRIQRLPTLKPGNSRFRSDRHGIAADHISGTAVLEYGPAETLPPVGAQWKACRVSTDPVVKRASHTCGESPGS